MLFCKYEVSQTNPSIQQRNVRYMFLLLKHSFLLKTTDLWLRDYAPLNVFNSNFQNSLYCSHLSP